ncbi:N-acetylmuramoyl-L-alanine amidase [Mastigocoleus testarum]|uniref:N-acetylmuramoyl-L-alanine amidase n=1 Tax=Mastigocoleus testarum BC008 TaxID=371196 RepID=A0A0V8A133_9CYAN|nr:N-acetylmuramoyl-L-alanine amidase [Mastigocoleus testarum]KST65398.1 N-acetylmuramoyl-L-alanine amidase [Mastigocoleus testarum BC008]KST70462.1 N-acetylmuramoyl-L-alanine amidase [Mastigocoleus testarum BC008]
MFKWNDFVKVLASTNIEFAHLKVAQLAQAILESGWGKSELFKLHANPFGMKYRQEIHIALPVEYKAHDGIDIYCKFATLEDAVKGYWIFIDRPVYSGWRNNSATPEDFIRFIAFAGYIDGPFDGTEFSRLRKEKYISKVLKLIPHAQKLLENADSSLMEKPIWKKKGVILEVGHGKNPKTWEPGAVGVNGVYEYDLNWIAAKAAKSLLDEAGVPCVITDFGGINGKGLYDIGKVAADYDVFCSIHHNSADENAQGAEVLVHHIKGDIEDLELSSLMSAEIAKELGIRDRIANGRNSREKLSVLNGAEDTNVRVSVLAELYFIHVPVPNTKDWSTRGGEAIARAILKWLRQTL